MTCLQGQVRQVLEDSARTRCEIWTRVMGYHRPVSNFNAGKKSEHYERKHFSEVASSESKRTD
jgi:anaerobic ribonucleoside-triphosphate reductase